MASIALQNGRRHRSLSHFFYCCMFPDAYPTYLQWWKKGKRMNILFLFSFSPSLCFFSGLIRWTIERWCWQWQARQRHAKCRLSLSVNRRTSWRVISLMDYKVGNNDSALVRVRANGSSISTHRWYYSAGVHLKTRQGHNGQIMTRNARNRD